MGQRDAARRDRVALRLIRGRPRTVADIAAYRGLSNGAQEVEIGMAEVVSESHFTTANAHGFDHFAACGLRPPEWMGVSFVLNPSVYLSGVWVSQPASGQI